MFKRRPFFVIFFLFWIVCLYFFITQGFIFSADEIRIAQRAYMLSHYLKDELGRDLPFVFNSLNDYQLPLYSYLVALGSLIFGKTVYSFWSMQMLLVLGIMFLTYKIGNRIFTEKVAYSSLVILVFSFGLIFMTNTPRDTLLLTFIVYLLIYRAIYQKLRFWPMFLILAAGFLTSKLFWFIAIFLVLLMSFFSNLKLKPSLRGLLITILMTAVVFIGYLYIPQGKRSLEENYFAMVNYDEIINGINSLRGQGKDTGVPNEIVSMIFNKLLYIPIGILFWASHLNLSIFFGRIDLTGTNGFSLFGIWPKIFLIPFLIGLLNISRSDHKYPKYLLLLFPILVFPGFFNYPHIVYESIYLTIPLAAIVIAKGVSVIPKSLQLFGVLILALELISFNLLGDVERKNSSLVRPVWIDELASDINKIRDERMVLVSDDIVEDVIPFIVWKSNKNEDIKLDLDYAYRFKQTKLKNLKLIGSENKLSECIEGEVNVYLSKRDVEKTKEKMILERDEAFYDNHGNEIAVRLKNKNLCIN